MMHRGGGADVPDDLSEAHEAKNCSILCYYAMTWGGLFWNAIFLPQYDGYFDAQYFKCFETSSAAPRNGLRIQYPSQYNTFNIDPAVPEMNVTDWNACLCMLGIYSFMTNN